MARRHHLIGDHHRPHRAGGRERATDELAIGGHAPARTQHGFDDHRRQRRTVLGDDALGSRGVVVGRQHHVVGRVPRSGTADEVQNSAVVATDEGQDLGAPGGHHGGGDGHEVGLGARVGEAHAIDAEALAHEAGQRGFGRMDAAHADVVVEGGLHLVQHPGFAVAQQARGVVAQQVDVFVAVDVDQGGTVAGGEGQRERGVGQNGTGMTARHEPAGLVVVQLAGRIAVGEITTGHQHGVGKIHARTLIRGRASPSVHCAPTSSRNALSDTI